MATDEQLRRDVWLQLDDETRAWIDRSTPFDIIRAAVDRGFVSDWRQLASIARAGATEIVDPAIVADFALAYTGGEEPKRVLDPWAGLGITLAALDARGRLRAGVAIELNTAVFDLGRSFSDSQRIEWHLGDASVVLSDSIGSFDLVVGFPPVGLPTFVLETQRPPLRITASKTYTMLIQAAGTLSPEGSILVVLPESFFSARNENVRAALGSLSIYPQAALALPRRFFSTTVPMTLCVFGRQATESLFVAELDAATDMAAVVANLRRKREGQLPQLGRLVPASSFRSWRAVLGDLEIRQAARVAGLRIVPFSDLCSGFHGPRRTGESFRHEPNSVYLPKLGTSLAVTAIDDFQVKPQNYLQLVVRPELAEAEYVAGFLNSPLGRRVREQHASGNNIPQISLARLREGMACLPPSVEQQRTAVRVARTLTELQQSIRSLDRELWDRPLQARRIDGELQTLLQGDGLDRWVESLPFPLASVLWRYLITAEPEGRFRNLVRFFESATLFLVDIHISALRGDVASLQDLIGRGKAEDGIYSHGSIGIWADLLARLAKRTRELLQDDPARVLELFRVRDPSRLEAIANKVVINALLHDAAAYRRDWVGHAAVAGRHDWESRLALAEATLARFREVLADAFAGWSLVRPGQGRNHGGVITTDIEQIVGSRSQFRQSAVDLRELPEEGGLVHVGVGRELAPPTPPLVPYASGSGVSRGRLLLLRSHPAGRCALDLPPLRATAGLRWT